MHWVCKACTTAYAVDAPRCPHCGEIEHWDSFEYEELMMGKISKHGGLTSQATGAGFSDDPDDTRPAGTRVAENTGQEAQTDGTPLEADEDGTGQVLPEAESNGDEEQTSEPGRYADWNKADLIGEAERREPPVSTAGTKADITERLLADDQRREEQGA